MVFFIHTTLSGVIYLKAVWFKVSTLGTGQPFFPAVKKPVKCFFQLLKRYIWVHLYASTIYFYPMNKNKPGPKIGKKQNQAQRSPIGERLYRVRKSCGLTQELLGEKVGLSKRMVAHYETGSKAMTVVSLDKIAAALGVTVAYLMGERKAPPDIENNIKPSFKKRIEILRKLPPTDQQAIFRMIDNAAKS